MLTRPIKDGIIEGHTYLTRKGTKGRALAIHPWNPNLMVMALETGQICTTLISTGMFVESTGTDLDFVIECLEYD